MSTEFHRRYVWPFWLRLAHWVIVLSMLMLIASGWLLGSGHLVNELLVDRLHGLHLVSGQLLGLALVLRLGMLFVDTSAAGWRALRVTANDAQGAAEMLRFYLAFGRRRMPGFYAHDPLWKLVYPAFFFLLLFQTFSGLGLEYGYLRSVLRLGSDYLSAWHATGAVLLIWLSGLHVAAVLLREVRSKGCEVSAMLHGYRLFEVDKGGLPDVQPKTGRGVSVTLDPGAKSSKDAD